MEQGIAVLVIFPDPRLRSQIIVQESCVSAESKHELVDHDKIYVKIVAHESS